MRARVLISVLLFAAVFSVQAQKGKIMASPQVIRMQVANDPTISFRVWFKVGSQDDPAGKEGLAYITSRMLAEGGTQSLSYAKILEKLYPLAAYYDAEASTEMTIFSGRVHQDNLSEYYPLFVDQLLNPAFSKEDFDRIKENAVNFIATTLKYSSDEELGKAVLYNEIYSGTPYAHLVSGSLSGLNSITLDDVKAFYKKFWNAANVVVGIGGGFSKELEARLLDDLKKLPAGKANTAPKVNPRPLTGINVTIIEKKAASTAISMGFPLPLVRGSKEWYALAIANSWLGEHRNSSSHLYQVIRERRGLNYGDYSYIEHYPNGGRLQMPPVNVPRRQHLFEIWIRPVPNAVRHFAIRAALREFDLLVKNGLSQAQFELTSKFLRNYVLHYATTTDKRLAYAIDDQFYGLKKPHLAEFRAMMASLTLKDVNNAIKKYWSLNNLQIAIITENADELKNALSNNTPSPITYTSPKDKEILDEDVYISNYKLPITADRVSVKKVEDLFK